jgi:type II secretory pathway component PulF
MLRIPVIGDLIIKGNVARFALMFRTLIKSGLPLVRSLDILVQTIKNTAIAAELAELREILKTGRDAELINMERRYLPDLALHMISIGLESGSLETMLRELGDHYGKEVRYTSRQLTSLLEPLLTLVMGVFVLMLALAIFLPMWNLIQVFKGQ